MSVHRQGGYVSGMLVSLIVFILLFIGAASFGVWAFLGRQDYKNNSDQKAAIAAAESKKVTEEAEAVKYAEAAKNPLKSYVGPSQFGAVTLQYPKTWSGYIVEANQGATPVNDYFHPNVVPNVNNDTNAFALRVEVLSQSYDRALEQYKSNITSGKVTSAPYALPKVPTVVGTRIEGQIEQNKKGVIVVLPLRNMTLRISTESVDFVADFNNIILSNLSFSP